MPPSAPPLFSALAARWALDALSTLGVASGWLVALGPHPLLAQEIPLNLQVTPLSGQKLEAFTATKEQEAFAPTTIVRVNVNAVLGALREMCNHNLLETVVVEALSDHYPDIMGAMRAAQAADESRYQTRYAAFQ